MTKKCCIPTCGVESDQPRGRNLTFHTVPAEEKIREEWVNILKEKFNITLKKYSYICCLHFEPSCFYYTGLCKNKRIKKGSCPTIFLDYKNDKVQKKCESAKAGEQAQEENENNQINDCMENHVIYDQSQEESPVNNNAALDDNNLGKEHSNDCVNISNVINGQHKKKYYKKSILNLDINSLNVSSEVQEILIAAKTEVSDLRRRTKTLQMRWHRYKQKVKNLNVMLLHMKRRKFISENLHKLLDVSTTGKIIEMI